ncbi:MAG: hypothetical protein AABW75_05000 [Nanoarchaeota archaeon]
MPLSLSEHELVLLKGIPSTTFPVIEAFFQEFVPMAQKALASMMLNTNSKMKQPIITNFFIMIFLGFIAIEQAYFL